MTRRADFTSDQWATLLDAFPRAAAAVAVSSGSSAQTVEELGAFVAIVGETVADDAGDLLLGDLVEDLQGRLASGGGVPIDPATAYMDGIAAAREGGAVLAVVADPVQADLVCSWFIRVLYRVAEAAREGGLLGLGGAQVSDRERTAISELAEAFGADPTEGHAHE